VPHIGQVIVEVGFHCIFSGKDKSEHGQDGPKAQGTGNQGRRHRPTANRTRRASRGHAAVPEQHPTTRDQADDSNGEQRRAMRSGEQREAAEPRAGEAE
jgi:hypothetical protein